MKLPHSTFKYTHHFQLRDLTSGIVYDQDRGSGEIDEFIADRAESVNDIDWNNCTIGVQDYRAGESVRYLTPEELEEYKRLAICELQRREANAREGRISIKLNQ